jgi:1-acyl-sn-glycerol-3-phosphate acyltransferase
MKSYQRLDKVIAYQVSLGLLRLYMIVFRLHCHVSGARQLPPGSKILAINHPNITDGFFIPLIFPERIFTLMNENTFHNPVTGWLLAKSEQIPVIPGKKLEAFWKAREVLRLGYTVMIFPEGRLNPEQVPVKAGSGAVCLSLKTGAPILPVGIYVADQDTFTFEYWAKNIMHSGRCQIHGCCYICVGQPWYPAREISERNGQAAAQLTENLMEKIQSLTDQAAQLARLEQAAYLSISVPA